MNLQSPNVGDEWIAGKESATVMFVLRKMTYFVEVSNFGYGLNTHKNQNERFIKGFTAMSYQNDIFWSAFVLHGMAYTDMILALDNIQWKSTRTKYTKDFLS